MDAIDCSEECLLASIKDTKSLHNDGGIEKMIDEMRRKKCYDIRLLEKLR